MFGLTCQLTPLSSFVQHPHHKSSSESPHFPLPPPPAPSVSPHPAQAHHTNRRLHSFNPRSSPYSHIYISTLSYPRRVSPFVILTTSHFIIIHPPVNIALQCHPFQASSARSPKSFQDMTAHTGQPLPCASRKNLHETEHSTGPARPIGDVRKTDGRAVVSEHDIPHPSTRPPMSALPPPLLAVRSSWYGQHAPATIYEPQNVRPTVRPYPRVH